MLGGAYGSDWRPLSASTSGVRPLRCRDVGEVNVDAAEEKVSEVAAAAGTAGAELSGAERSVCASVCWKLGTRGG